MKNWIRIGILAIICLSITNTLNAQENKPIKRNTYYTIHLAKGEQWQEGKSILQQDLKAHGKYMKQLFDSGTLIMAGPYADADEALIILNVKSREVAQEILEHDPATINKIFIATLHEWVIPFDAFAEANNKK